MLNPRARLLWLTVEAATMPLPDHPGVRALHGWLDTWRAIGDLETGMARQGYDLQLTRYADPRNFAIAQWVRDEQGVPVFRITHKDIRAASTAATMARQVARDA